MNANSLGIEFGATQLACAYVTAAGHPQILANAEGNPTTPLAIDVSQDPPLIGDLALGRVLKCSPDAILIDRRHIGLQRSFRLAGREWTETELIQPILQKVKRDAESVLGGKVSQVMLGVPAYSEQPQLEDYRVALLSAGFEVVQLVQEPVATILAHIHKSALQDGNYLIYALDSSSFNATVLNLSNGSVTLLSKGGDLHLGSEAWGRSVAEWVADLRRIKGSPWEPPSLEQLSVARQMIDALNTRSSVTIPLSQTGQLRSATLTRTEFEQFIAGMLQRTGMICQRTLEQPGMNWNTLAGILLTGEATRMPSVQDYVKQVSGRDPVFPIEGSVALGAAMAAQQQATGRQISYWQSDTAEITSVGGSLTSENEPLRVVDSIEIPSGRESSKIEFCVGDLTMLGAENAVDVLVLSAFPDDYTPLPGSLIGALQRRGLSVADLATQKEVDLRESFSCWLSHEIPTAITGLHFKRILCFEPYMRGAPEGLVGDIFRSLAPFVAGDNSIRSVATPIVASGYQGVDADRMFRLLVEAAVQWMSVGMPLRCLKIVCLPGPSVARLEQAFAEVKGKFLAQQPTRKPRFNYDAFVSYAHADSNEAHLLEGKLLEMKSDLRLFIDRKRLNPGAAWQQQIYESLDDCARVITILTPAYLLSKVCLEEFNIAVYRNRESNQRILVPLYLYTAELPTYMKVLHLVDCRECDLSKVGQGLANVLDELLG